MFDREKNQNEFKPFDVELNTGVENNTPEEQGDQKKKKIAIISAVAVLVLSGAGVFIKNLDHEKELKMEAVADQKVMFIPLEEMTVNLRNGVENNAAWLRIKVSLEVHGKNNYDTVSQMTPKIVDVFQTYLKELRKTDLDGSFGIYKMKDEMMLRINTIIYPARIEAILFQEFIMQTI
jgi:flagellar FliL protein